MMDQTPDRQVVGNHGDRAQPSKLRQFCILSLELLLAVPIGLALSHFNIGGMAWILGGITAGTGVLYLYRTQISDAIAPNRNARKAGLSLVGLSIGFTIAHGNLSHVITDLPILILLTGFILVSGSLNGYLYSRLSQTQLLTALLATVPGGVSVMAGIAAEYEQDAALVSLVQIIRVTAVILLIPFVARTALGLSTPIASASPTLPSISMLLHFDLAKPGLLAMAIGGMLLSVMLMSRLRIPAAPFFGALIAGIGFNPLINSLPWATTLDFSPPIALSILGQILLGITIGEYWGYQPPPGPRIIGYALIPVVLTLTAGGMAAGLAMLLTPWDWLTCLLVTAPGGAAEMILVALAFHQQVEIVTAGHLVRLIAINSSLPLWLWLLRQGDRPIPET